MDKDAVYAIERAYEAIEKAVMIIDDLFRTYGNKKEVIFEHTTIFCVQMVGALIWYDGKWWKVCKVYGSCCFMRLCTEQEYMETHAEEKMIFIQ